eukprot:TRINITY_DN3140_c0_g1_i2.p1 TRINITY_DN3140_c0_g1~~TRINITY_DN3140_c0_g1_i2.p1  ORF type:complete len:321 (-),score=128.09 TRINITY_DN3140_c0_g1_i2:761-1723(-)
MAAKMEAKRAVNKAFRMGGEKNVSEGNHYSGVSASGLSDYFFGRQSQDDYYEEEEEEELYYYDDEEYDSEEEEEELSIDDESFRDLQGEWDENEDEEDLSDVEINEEEEEKDWRKKSINNLLNENRLIRSSETFLKREESNSPKSPEEKNQNQCSICLEDLEETSVPISVQGCNHVFCKECLANYIAFKTQDASNLFHQVTFVTREGKLRTRLEVVGSYGIPCPARHCRHVMLINELVPVVNPQTVDQFLRFSAIHQRQALEIQEGREGDGEEEIIPIHNNNGSKICTICKKEVFGKIVKVKMASNYFYFLKKYRKVIFL